MAREPQGSPFRSDPLLHLIAAKTGCDLRTIRRWMIDPRSVTPLSAYAFEQAMRELASPENSPPLVALVRKA